MGRLALESNFSFGNSLAERWSVKVYEKCDCRESVKSRPGVFENCGHIDLLFHRNGSRSNWLYVNMERSDEMQ